MGVFYKGNEYASLNPNFLGCAENALGIREWLESKGHKYIVTDDKEGPNCGQYTDTKNLKDAIFICLGFNHVAFPFL